MKAVRRVRVKAPPKFDPSKYKPGKIATYDAYARSMLRRCDEIFDESALLDTAVRDTVSEGLAFMLHSAYDSQACSLGLDGAAFHSFIEGATAEWFRERGYAEWFCHGAAALFSTSRPRTIAERKMVIKFGRPPGKKKRRAA